MSISRHPKHNFLIERIAFFSDAVFAIAITLLTIEIHPPVLTLADSSWDVMHKLKEKLPDFLGLVASFWLIGSAWLRHHQLFKYVDNYDIKFKVMNLFLLLTIIFFPFTTSFLFNTIFSGIVTKPQVIFYLVLPLSSNIILYRMFRLVNRKHLNGATDKEFEDSMVVQRYLIVSFILALLWIIILPIGYHPFGYIFLFLGMILNIINKRKNKKPAPHAKS